ncbi:O-antigen ligase family protein [bacterium]|nr:O-antigen ligase family protein [bacterium]
MTGPYQIPRPILLALTVLAALGGCLDYAIGPISPKILNISHIQFYLVCAAVAAMLLGDREGDWRRRLLFGAAFAGFAVACAYGLHEVIFQEGRRHLERLKMPQSFTVVYLTASFLWLSAPMLTVRRLDGTRRGPWLPFGMELLIIYTMICLATAIMAPRPIDVLRDFTMERALPMALIAGWARAAERDKDFLRDTGLAIACVFGALMVISVLINIIDLAGPASIRARLVDWNLVFSKAERAGWEIPRRRIEFPMLHFNRTAYWAMLGMMMMLVAARAAAVPRRRWAAFALAAAGFWIIMQTYTRGIAMAAMAGAFVWIATISRRILIGAVAVAVIAAIAIPSTFSKQMKTVFDPRTYMVNQPPLTSMKTRIMAWGWSLQSIREHPLSGLGYSRKNVERAYKLYVFTEGSEAARQSLSGSDEMKHVHNVWLETMAESGVAAGLALLGFCIVRWAALLLAWRRANPADRGVAGAWLAFELALLIAGMNFYMLKQNFGSMTFFIWAYALVWAASALDRRSDSCSCS